MLLVACQGGQGIPHNPVTHGFPRLRGRSRPGASRTRYARLNWSPPGFRIEHLSYVVTSHMDSEEKQREKLEQELNGIGTRVGKLTKLLWLIMGIAGGPQILQMVAEGTIPM